MNRYRLAALATVTLASVAPAVPPATAQRVTAHLSLAPPTIGLNPVGIGQFGTSANQTADEVVFLSARGITLVQPSTGMNWSWELDPGSTADAAFGLAVEQRADGDRRMYVADVGDDMLHVYSVPRRALLYSAPLPFSPGRVALDETAGVAWVLSASSGEVAAFQTETLALVGTVAVTDVPSDLAVDPTRARVYVTARGANELYRIELSPLGLAATVPLDREPTTVRVNPALGKVYVVRESDADPALAVVSVVSETDDSVIASPAVDSALRLAINPMNGRAYTAGDDGTGTALLYWLDGTQTPDVLVPGPALAGPPAGLDVDSAGGRVFAVVTSNRGRTVEVYHEATSMLDPAVLTPGSGTTTLAWHEPSARLWLPNAGIGNTTGFDPAAGSGSFVQTGVAVENGGVNEVVALNPKAYFLVPSRDEVAVVNTTTFGVTTVAVPAEPLRSTFLPARNELQVLHASGRVISVISGVTDTLALTSPALPHISLGFAASQASNLSYVGNFIVDFAAPVDQFQSFDSTTNMLTDRGPAAFDPCLYLIPLTVATNSTTGQVFSSVINLVSFADQITIWDEGTASWSCVDVPDSFVAFFLGVSEALNRVYVGRSAAAPAGPAVMVVDPAGLTVAGTVTTSAEPNAFAVDDTGGRERLYASLTPAVGGEVAVIDTMSNSLVGTIATGGSPFSLLSLPASDTLYVDNSDLEEVQVVQPASTAAGTPSSLTDVASFGGVFGINTLAHETMRNRVLYVDNKHGTVAVIDAAAGFDDMQVTSGSLAAGIPGFPYSETLTVAGGTGPYVWQVVSGMLPPGLMLNPDGTIAGMPAGEGTWSFIVSVTDSSTPSVVDVEDLQITVLGPTVVTRALPGGVEGVGYSAVVVAAGGLPCASPPAYSWTVTGMLPPGLTLNADGSITGTPTMTGNFCFTVEATDCNIPTGTASRDLCIDVTGAAAGVNLLRNDEITALSPLTPPKAALFTGTASDATLEVYGPNATADAGEGALECAVGSSEDDDFYVANWNSGDVDPGCPMVGDTSRPLMFWQITAESDMPTPPCTILMVKNPSGSCQIFCQ